MDIGDVDALQELVRQIAKKGVMIAEVGSWMGGDNRNSSQGSSQPRGEDFCHRPLDGDTRDLGERSVQEYGCLRLFQREYD